MFGTVTHGNYPNLIQTRIIDVAIAAAAAAAATVADADNTDVDCMFTALSSLRLSRNYSFVLTYRARLMPVVGLLQLGWLAAT